MSKRPNVPPRALTRREQLRAWIEEGMEIKRQQEQAAVDAPETPEKMDFQRRDNE